MLNYKNQLSASLSHVRLLQPMDYSPAASSWERLTEGETGTVLMGGAMLSKSLIQFSVDGWRCVPSLLLTWGQTMVEASISLLTFSINRQTD